MMDSIANDLVKRLLTARRLNCKMVENARFRDLIRYLLRTGQAKDTGGAKEIIDDYISRLSWQIRF